MQQNLVLTLGFKGQGNPNGVPAAAPNGLWTLGGYQDSTDTQTPKFGVVMCSSPAQADGDFFCGALTASGVANVYLATVSGTSATAGNINIDGTVVAIASGVVASGVTGSIVAASGSLYRWNITASGTTQIVFTSKLATIQPKPTFADSSPATGISVTYALTTSGVYGSTPRGITLYDGGVAEVDPAKPNYIIQGAPITLLAVGQIWLNTWIGATNWIGGTAGNQTTQDASGAVLTGALSTAVLGAVVVASNVTGEIGLLANGSSAPAGYSIISAYIKSVSMDTNGVLLFVTI
jgi:hypothetical protein